MIVQRAVSALAVIKGFDVIKDLSAGIGAGEEGGSVNKFEFESAPKAFHGGVVIAVGFAAHGGDEAGLGKREAIVGAGILNTTIGVE